jgi:hypothetical protein
MFVVKAADGTAWYLPSLTMARKFAWRRAWGYPKGERLEIFKGSVLVATETIWRADLYERKAEPLLVWMWP